jgi:4-hydroxy-tetrahydrodipicolinate reductase
MKIALIGYGRMGKETEKVALERGHTVVARIDTENDWETQLEALKNADIAIDFSIPATAPSNILKCFRLDLPLVCGVTGWLERFSEIRDVCLNEKKAFFYAPNFSIGVNVFFEINKRLAQLMKSFPEYEIDIEETHHIHKADAPSGTAIRLADDIVAEMEHKTGWTGIPQTSGNELIGIQSFREGEVTGYHTVKYSSANDEIEISHSAKSRRGFATGAVVAAEWLIGKRGCFGMSDLLNINLKQ